MVFDSARRCFFAVVIGVLLFFCRSAHGDDSPLRAYFVGNSVTDTIRYGSLAKLAKSQAQTLTWGRDMIPGAPLPWLWEHPKDGFQEEPFGLYPKALSEYTWDVLSLQPFDRHLDAQDGDLAMARNFIDLALKRSPDVQVYVYSRWPRKDKAKNGSLVLDYKTKWLRKYTGGWDGTEETRDYFERVVAGLRKAYAGKAKPALLVPVGDVLLELNERMKVGKVPGFTDIAEVYVDSIHFNNVGSCIVGTTFYATIFRDDPRGMTADPYNEKLDPKKDRLIDEKLAAAIQDAVWTVVTKHTLAGVRIASHGPNSNPIRLREFSAFRRFAGAKLARIFSHEPAEAKSHLRGEGPLIVRRHTAAVKDPVTNYDSRLPILLGAYRHRLPDRRNARPSQ